MTANGDTLKPNIFSEFDEVTENLNKATGDTNAMSISDAIRQLGGTDGIEVGGRDDVE